MSVRSLKPFTPTRESPADLAARTVGRDALVQVLVDRLVKAARTADRTHSLLIGPRGSGKTHLVEVVLHHLNQLPESSRLLVARLAEDVVGIVDPRDLLIEVVDSINATRSAEARTLGAAGDIGAIEDLIAEIAGGRTLVLVIENLSRLFAKLGTEGQRAIRAWVETSRQVVLLATTPRLTEATSDRDAPWFGSFTPNHLDDLSPSEGQLLLVKLHRDDPDLAEYLASDEAHRRLQALAHLAGGSPRLWVIAAMCVTVESLDELVPAVEDLLDKLVPYYQERLWELSGLEQKLVKAIAAQDSVSVRELAAFVGEAQRSVGSTLGRLEEVGWIRATKIPGRDQRLTFYELCEPLVKHHLDYRNTYRRSLRLLVDVLRVWFDPSARLRLLGHPDTGGSALGYLADSLWDHPVVSDSGYVSRSVNDLVAAARLWVRGQGGLGSPALGEEILALVDQARRAPSADCPQLADRVGNELRRRVDAELNERGRHADLTDFAILRVIEAYWNSASTPALGLARLVEIGSDELDVQVQHLLRAEIAYNTGQAGNPRQALELATQLLPDREQHLGQHHPDTLSTRHQIAYYTGETGDSQQALHLYTQLLPDREQHLGQHHRDTLSTRHQIAYYTGETGDAQQALHLYTQLLPDREQHLGQHHPDTLNTRHQIAYYTGETGDAQQALHLYTQLLPDREQHLGQHHRDTLNTRHQVAYYTGETGDAQQALHLYTQLLPDTERHLGEDHQITRAVASELSVLKIRLEERDGLSPTLRSLIGQPEPDDQSDRR